MIDKRIEDTKVSPGEHFIDKNGKHRVAGPHRFTQDNQPSNEVRSKGAKKRWARKRLADDIVNVLIEKGTLEKGFDTLHEQVKNGDLTNLMKVLPLVTVKNIDVTSDGERVQMQTIAVDGVSLDYEVGDMIDVTDDEEEDDIVVE